MNKTLISVLLLCIIGSSTAFQIDVEKCFIQAATFTHQVKALAAAAEVKPVPIANILGALYDTAETVNPLIQGCGFDIPLIDQVDSYKPVNATNCFVGIEKITNIALEIKEISAKKDISEDIFNILPKIIEAFKLYKQAKLDCEIVPKQPALLSSNGFDINIFKCIEETKITIDNAKKFVADYKAGVEPMEDLFEEGINVYNEFVVVLRDCAPQKIALPAIENVSELKVCVKDIKTTVQSIEETIVTLKARQFKQLLTNVKNVYAAIVSDVKDCPKKSLLGSADILKCIKDGLSIVKDLKKFVDSAKSKSTKDIVIGAYTVLGELNPLVKDCDLELPIEIPEINAADLENCAVNTDGLVNTISQLSADISDKKLWNVVGDATLAVTQLQEIVNDCKTTHTLQAAANPLNCIQNAKQLYENASALIENSKSKNVPEIVVGAYTIIESLQPLFNECGLKVDLHIPTITFPDLKGCVVDAQSLVDTIKDIRDSFSNKNFLKIFDDVSSAVVTLQTIANICKPQQTLESGTDFLACLTDAKALYVNAEKLINDKKTDAPLPQIVVGAYNILESLQPLVDACGLKVDLHIPTIAFPDLNGCVVDTQGLVEVIKAIRDGIKEKQYINIFDHVAATVMTLQSIANECKPIKALESGTDFLACLTDAKALYVNAEKLINDKKTDAPLPQIVVGAYNILESLQPLVDACGLKVDLHIPTIVFPDLNGCVVDTQGLVEVIKAIRDDIKEKQYINIFDHVAATVMTLQSIANECKPVKNLLSFNILKCIQSGEKTYKDVKNFIDINSEHKPLNEVIVSAFTIIKEIQPTLDDCGLKVDLHIPDIDFNDLNGCVVDSSSVINDFKTIAQNLKDKEYLSIVSAVQSAIGHIKAISDECKVHNNSKIVLQANILTCAKEAEKMRKRTVTLIGEFKTKQAADIIVSAYDIVENLQPLVDACIPKQVDLHIPKIAFSNLHDCIVDVQSVFTIISTIKNDVQVKNWSKIVGDAKNFISTFQAIRSACAVSKNALQSGANVLVCLANAKKAYIDVQNFVEINKEKKPLNEIIVNAFAILEETQPLFDSCGIKADLHIPSIEFNDLNGCVVDGQAIVNNAKSLLADLKEREFLKAITSAKAIAESAKNVATECKYSKNVTM